MSRRLVLVSFVALAMAGCGGSSKTATSIPGTTTSPARVIVKPPQRLQFGRSVRLRAVSGTVRVSTPSSGGSFTALAGTRFVPVGTSVDATRGVVEVTTALPSNARTDTGVFQLGRFKIAQSRSAGGLTDLTVLDEQTVASACANRGHRRATPLQLGILLGSAHGGFRTDGEFAAATVRGTRWGTRNRCDGTLSVDREGVVVVTQYHPHRTITLHSGQTFLAKAP